MIRKLAATVATAALALSLAACGESSTRSADGSTSSSKGDTSKTLTLKDIQDAGTITVGTEGTYKPFTYHEGGTGDLTGFDVEIMNAVGEKLGVTVKYEETQWDAIFAGLDSGRFDAIANQVSITPERQATYLFSTPYTYSPGVVVVKKDNTSIKSLADLKGKTTAQSLTSNWFEMAKAEGAKVNGVEGWAQAVMLVKQGRVDATLNDVLTFLDWQKTEKDTSLKVAVTTDEVSENAITFRQGSEDLVAAVDKALADLKADGTLKSISEKYFGEDVTVSAS